MGALRKLRRNLHGGPPRKLSKERRARAGVIARLERAGLTTKDALLVTGYGGVRQAMLEAATRDEAAAKLEAIEAYHRERKEKEGEDAR